MQDCGQPDNHVLVVDDEESLRQVIGIFLQREGFTPLTAANGTEGVALFREHAPGVVCVIVDKSMPGMDGVATAEAIRGLNPGVPVIIASGYPQVDVGGLSRDVGPTAFIKKPFSLPELMRLVREVVGRP